MLTRKEEQEHVILSVIHLCEEPIGSGSIREQVATRGLEMSEATVGRLLKELDSKGYTVKKGFQGRTLTDEGYKRLCDLKHCQERAYLSQELADSLRPESKKDMVDVLVARRAIEGEIAALAATHISTQEIDAIDKVLIHHDLHRQRGEFGVEQDISFHRLLAKACRNQVLEKAMELIRQQGRHSPTLEYIRNEVKSAIIEDHKRIFEAVKAHDPESARTAMNIHIENLIRDVERYWQKHQNPDPKP